LGAIGLLLEAALNLVQKRGFAFRRRGDLFERLIPSTPGAPSFRRTAANAAVSTSLRLTNA